MFRIKFIGKYIRSGQGKE